MHDNSKLLFEKHARPFFRPGMRVLEIGPDSIPSTYQSVINEPTLQWETLDIHKTDPRLTYITDGEYVFPVASNSFDIVLSGQVIEHVRMIWKWMQELARICKPGGVVITICPVTWPYHPHPFDCWRIYPEGMKALHEDSGLETQLALTEGLEPAHLRKQKWFLAKQTIKAFLGWSPFRAPFHPKLNLTLDTISVARKPE